MKLSVVVPRFYRVKRGQTLSAVASAFSLPPCLLVRENGLRGELRPGQVIRLPSCEGNFYVVRGGESKSLLCGSPARFEEKNGTARLYVGQRILL